MKKILKLLSLLLLLTSCTTIGNNQNNNDNTQDKPNENIDTSIKNTIEFKETIEEFDSSDCGFYDPVYIKCNDDGVTAISDRYLKYNNLLHLRIDISYYSKAINNEEDKIFSSNMLTSLKKEFDRIYNSSATAIIRFAYDPGFNGAKDMEPSIEMMKTHITQLKPIFNNYSSIITAIECGMVGPWGEMHSSKIANQQTYNELIKCYLENTPKDVSILVRRPKFIYSYYGYNLDNLNELTLDSNNRIGVYNDGYLGSSSDLGTYDNREKEVNWLAKVNKYLPYGGEVTIPNSEYNLLENCNEEMDLLNLSYLNECWNDQVIKRWKETKYDLDNQIYKNSTQFTYIKNHMGYRLVLNKLDYEIKNDKFIISFDIKNVGFGNLLKTKRYSLLLKNDTIQKEFYSEAKTYENLKFEINNIELNDSYDIYLKISDGYNKDLPMHSIHLANNIWNDELYANKVISNLKIKLDK